tara:strand:+ start:2268 stop:2522 length:255 start_codon:yes stop_codon:yes gene_type:complete
MFSIITAMKAFLNYEYMITPGVLKILSYIAMVIAFIAGLFTAFTVQLWEGLGVAILGPIIVRIYAELMLVIFELHKEIKKIAAK